MNILSPNAAMAVAFQEDLPGLFQAPAYLYMKKGDLSKAREFYEKACLGGDAVAACNLDCLYEEGVSTVAGCGCKIRQKQAIILCFKRTKVPAPHNQSICRSRPLWNLLVCLCPVQRRHVSARCACCIVALHLAQVEPTATSNRPTLRVNHLCHRGQTSTTTIVAVTLSMKPVARRSIGLAVETADRAGG